MLRLRIALPQSGQAWRRNHLAGVVPDASPYGLDRLERWGISPTFGDPSPNRTRAERVLDRLTGWDWAGGRLERAGPSDAYLAWDEKRGLPLLLRARGRSPVYTGVIWATDSGLSLPVRRMTAKALSQAAGVFVLSRLQIPYLAEHFGVPDDRLHYVRFGIDADFFRPDPPVPGGASSTIFSAGSDRHRDFELLVRAVVRLRQARPEVRLRVATRLLPPGPLPGGAGECLGAIDHPSMRRELSGAGVVVVPTSPNIHGSGMTTVLEAMACGRPVVAMTGTGLEDYVTDGLSGTLVPPGDEDLLVRAIDAVLSDPEMGARQGERGREAVLRHHTSSRMVDRLGRMIAASGADEGVRRASDDRGRG